MLCEQIISAATSGRLFHTTARADSPLVTGLMVAGGALAAKYVIQVRR